MRVLLVEDDPRFGDILADELGHAGHVVLRALDAVGATVLVHRHRPDVMILDLGLIASTGFDVLRALAPSPPPTLVLTARADSAEKIRALDMGADDYLVKPIGLDELLARMRAVLRRHGRPTSVSFGDVVVDLGGRRVTVAGEPAHLTPTEYELLAYFAQRPGRVLPRESLVRELLLGDDETEAALQVHVSRLRRKLGASGGAIGTVWGVGYRLDIPGPSEPA